jgi:hypothetical protein
MPALEHARCEPGQVLMDADSALDHVYFPESGVVSIVAVYADGSIIEMATIGREGCTGLQVTLSMPIDGANWGQPGLLSTKREGRPHVS